jgi:hypothetical protein
MSKSLKINSKDNFITKFPIFVRLKIRPLLSRTIKLLKKNWNLAKISLKASKQPKHFKV